MNIIKKTLMFCVSGSCLIIMIVSSVLTDALENLMTKLMVSEKMCVRCNKEDENITSEIPVCKECKAIIDAEHEEEECSHGHGPPMSHDHMTMYR